MSDHRPTEVIERRSSSQLAQRTSQPRKKRPPLQRSGSRTARAARCVLGVCLAICFVSACAKKDASKTPPAALKYGLTPEQSTQTVLKTASATLTLGQLAERLATEPPTLTARYDAPAGRREFLAEMVRFELLASEATRRGYDENPTAERAAQEAMVQGMMRDLFEKNGVKLSDVSDAEIAKYYSDNEKEFKADGRSLQNVRPVIQNRLWHAKRDRAISDFIAELRNKANLQENASMLSRIAIETEPPALAKRAP
jgi:hypothetical protein